MKNITQHFENTVKSSSAIPVYRSDDTKAELKCKNDTRRKRNRVKIKISKKDSKERVCDILESSSDMVDKTPSPFTKLDNIDMDLHDTPKSSLSKLSTLIKSTTSSGQYFDNLTLETNDVDSKNKRQNKNDSIEPSIKKSRKLKREVSNKTNNIIDVNISGIWENKDAVKKIDLVDDNSNDENKGSKEGPNAFLILMSRNKLDHSVPSTKLSPKHEEIDTKKLEEQKEKLKCSKDKLLSLADKKGYSKRKLAESQESEKIERTIQNRIKLLSGQEKRDNCIETTVLNSKQSPGSLLNYFSKVPVDLTHSNLTHMSTIVVKADVHVTDNSVTHNLYRSNCSNVIRPSRKCKKSNVELAQMEDINLVKSENSNILSNKNTQQDELQLNKHRWLLRVKIQAANHGHGSLDETSSEELYSPNVKVKLKAQRTTKSARTNSIDVKKVSKQSKQEVSKQGNVDTKSALKKYVEIETLEGEHVLQDYQNWGYNLKKNQKLININKSESTLIKDTKRKKLNSSSKLAAVHLVNMGDDDISKQNCIIITNNNNSKRKTTEKLAPLFTKRRKPDPEILAARRLFLHSDMTDNSDKNISRKVNVSGTLSFPLISHVTQSSTDVYSKTDAFNIPREVCKRHVPIINVNNFKQLMDFSERGIKVLNDVDKPEVQDVLVDIEKHCTNAKQMWDVISLIVKEHPKKAVSPKARARKNKPLEKRGKIINTSKEDQFKCCSWTYKYRPKNSQEVVGNEEAVAKLKEWLIGWKTAFTNEDVSSEDEFYSSDSNHPKTVERNKVAVLLGPHGCGKTASAYAVAEEFGYTVLELNASSRRTGKTILKELAEASKSHRIKRDDVTPILDEIVQNKMPQNSLILIEDVDIVFEEDEGFISATYQLALNTKRPIVMTCRDICPNLNRIAPQQNRIFFQDVGGNRVSALLELISLAETGYRLPPQCIAELLQTRDLRRAILQLQYLLLSGPPQTLGQSINFKNAFWQNMWHCLYRPAIKRSKKRKKKTNDDDVLNDKYAIIDIAYKLDNIALLSCLIDIEDSALNLWKIRAQPNLSLIESTAPYSASNNICLEIAEWIGNKVMHKDELNEHDVIRTQNTIMLKKELNNGVNLTLSQTTSLLLDRHVIATDYLPSVRAICRAEESRADTNNKRGKRFSHYLHNLKVTSMLLKPNILTAACKIMYDKSM